MANPLSWAEQQDMAQAIAKCESALASNSILDNNAWIREATFIFLSIYLNEILQKLKSINRRISFQDDISIRGRDNLKDITDLINAIRNSACHIKSNLHAVAGENNTGRFNIMRGKGTMMQIGEVSYGNDYEDDVAIWSGELRIYLNRHIKRAVAEAKIASQS